MPETFRELRFRRGLRGCFGRTLQRLRDRPGNADISRGVEFGDQVSLDFGDHGRLHGFGVHCLYDRLNDSILFINAQLRMCSGSHDQQQRCRTDHYPYPHNKSE